MPQNIKNPRGLPALRGLEDLLPGSGQQARRDRGSPWWCPWRPVPCWKREVIGGVIAQVYRGVSLPLEPAAAVLALDSVLALGPILPLAVGRLAERGAGARGAEAALGLGVRDGLRRFDGIGSARELSAAAASGLRVGGGARRAGGKLVGGSAVVAVLEAVHAAE